MSGESQVSSETVKNVEQVVHEYRVDSLGLLGFEEASAELLAASGVAVSRVRKMLDNGCPHELLFRIFV